MLTDEEKYILEQKLTNIISAGCGVPEPIELRIERCVMLFEELLIARENIPEEE